LQPVHQAKPHTITKTKQGPFTSENQIGRFFQTMYDGLSKDQRAWMPYEDPETKFPLTFHPSDNALNKDNDLMMAIITPRAIPVNSFGSGKNINTTYELYNPSAMALLTPCFDTSQKS